jgi:hypothetical protein|tara:strand:+ start:1427 stop:1678 length:252 start_codon:yes stop_codon:yes gene_type:complete
MKNTMINDIKIPDGTIILEPQNIFNSGVIGIDGVLLYSLSLLIDSFLDKTDLDYLDVIEHLSYNTWGYCPVGWPILIDDLNEE